MLSKLVIVQEISGNLGDQIQLKYAVSTGPVAQRITRLTTDQKIPGSNPGRLVTIFSRRKIVVVRLKKKIRKTIIE